MNLVFTHHAVERYVERHAPHMTAEEARAALEEAAHTAVRLRETSVRGHIQWKIDSVNAVAITKRDPGGSEDVVVTIVPARVNLGNDHRACELAMALEIVEERGAMFLVPEPKRPIPVPVPAIVSEVQAQRHKVARPINPARPPLSVKIDQNVMLHALMVEKAIEAARDKTLRHIATENRTASQQKAALRIAVSALLDLAALSPAAATALEQIAAIDAGLASREFADLWPRRADEAEVAAAAE